jgi:hypothetical protein
MTDPRAEAPADNRAEKEGDALWLFAPEDEGAVRRLAAA